MIETLIGLVGGLMGAVLGSYSAWLLAASASRKQTRRDILVKSWQDLESLRISYTHWYRQPIPIMSRSGWSLVKPVGEAPDPVYEGICLAFDQARSSISSDRTLLMAHFPSSVSERIKPMLDSVLELCSTRPIPPLEKMVESIEKAESGFQVLLSKAVK